VDFEKFTSAMSKVGNFIGFMVDIIIDAVQFAWNFRGVIIAILAPSALLSIALGGISLGLKIMRGWQLLSKAAMFLFADAAVFQTGVLATLKGGTLGYLLVSKAFEVATVVKTGLLNILTGGQLANAAATASMAVATGTATGAQWLLNAAMAANPIGFVITLVALLIGGIVLLVKNLDYVKAAFQSLGDIIVLALLAPLQLILEIIDLIPGVDLEATKMLRKTNSDALNRIGGRFGAVTENRKLKEKEKQDAKQAEMMKGMNIPGMEALDIPTFNTQDFGIPDFNTPDFSGSLGTTGISGKSKLHGVVDVSGGAPRISLAGSDLASKAAGSATTTTGASGTALIASTVTGIAVLLRNIDGNITAITGRSTQTGTNIAPEDDARNTAPITQAERMAYSLQEKREIVTIEVSAARGSEAKIINAPDNLDIQLVSSGGNA
jgi:hypothetical protein